MRRPWIMPTSWYWNMWAHSRKSLRRPPSSLATTTQHAISEGRLDSEWTPHRRRSGGARAGCGMHPRLDRQGRFLADSPARPLAEVNQQAKSDAKVIAAADGAHEPPALGDGTLP